jgi:hypothetical protein
MRQRAPGAAGAPWYGHCTWPPTALPCIQARVSEPPACTDEAQAHAHARGRTSESGQARCAHSSFMQAAPPWPSRKSTQGRPAASTASTLCGPSALLKAAGSQAPLLARRPGARVRGAAAPAAAAAPRAGSRGSGRAPAPGRTPGGRSSRPSGRPASRSRRAPASSAAASAFSSSMRPRLAAMLSCAGLRVSGCCARAGKGGGGCRAWRAWVARRRACAAPTSACSRTRRRLSAPTPVRSRASALSASATCGARRARPSPGPCAAARRAGEARGGARLAVGVLYDRQGRCGVLLCDVAVDALPHAPPCAQPLDTLARGDRARAPAARGQALVEHRQLGQLLRLAPGHVAHAHLRHLWRPKPQA